MTPAELKTDVALRVHKDISTADTDDDQDVESWVLQSIRHISGSVGQDWECQKKEWTLSSASTPALTGNTYAYSLRTLFGTAGLKYRKLQSDAIRYGGTMLEYVDEMEEIDRRLGPAWKDVADGGSPRYASVMGNNLILAPVPGTSFAAQKTIAGYYYAEEKLEDADGDTAGDWKNEELMLFDDLRFFVVELAVVFGLQQEDDSNYGRALDTWERKHMTELRGYDQSPHSNEQLEGPLWARSGAHRVY